MTHEAKNRALNKGSVVLYGHYTTLQTKQIIGGATQRRITTHSVSSSYAGPEVALVFDGLGVDLFWDKLRPDATLFQ